MANKLIDSIAMEVKESGACVREFAFSVSADVAKSENGKVVNYISGVAQLPGFRAGKAPAHLVAKKYANEIAEELRNRFLGTAVEKIESDDKLDLLSLRVKDFGDFKPGEAFTFTFEANVAPEIDLGDYQAVKVDVPLNAVEDKSIEERLDLYRNMYGNYADVEGAAQVEDMLKVDYKGDFALPEDASASLKRQVEATDAFLWLNEPENLPGCIKALTGAEIGKEYSFASEYPADYRESALAGKTVNYTVTVKAIQRRKKLTDAELVERTRSESIDALRENVRKALEGDAQAARRSEAADALFKKLDEQAGEFAIPEALLENEIQKALQKLARETVKSEADAEKFKTELKDHRAACEKPAKEAVRRMLILRKLAALEKITLSENEVEEQMRSMSRYYGYTPKALHDMLAKSGAIDELRADILNAKVLDKLVDAALK